MSVNTCLIYRCLSSASAVIRSWFIYELQKSTTIAFSRNSLYTFYSRNPTCGVTPCLRISNRKYPPCPQNSIIVNPPSPSEILKAVRGMVWIFSGIAQFSPGRNFAGIYFCNLNKKNMKKGIKFHNFHINFYIKFSWNKQNGNLVPIR